MTTGLGWAADGESAAQRHVGLPAIAKSWQGFWFGPQPMYTLGLVRIAFGAC